MARPKSQEKRDALLQSAVRAIAESGLAVPTSRIAQGAGVAEGTLFSYFPTKANLLCELYRSLKLETFAESKAGFPLQADSRQRALHIWTAYLLWALRNPAERKVSVLLHLSNQIPTEVRTELHREQSEISRTMQEVSQSGAFASLPREFASAVMGAMQDAVLGQLERTPRRRRSIIHIAFDAYWRMAGMELVSDHSLI